jgi:hypothetical protein
VRPLIEEPDGTKVLHATLPLEIDKNLRSVLDRYGIKAAKGGDLDVGFRRR